MVNSPGLVAVTVAVIVMLLAWVIVYSPFSDGAVVFFIVCAAVGIGGGVLLVRVTDRSK